MNPIYNYALNNNMLLTKDWSKYTAAEPIMKIKDVSEKQLMAFFQKAYISFYLRPNIVLKWLRNKQFNFIKSGIKAVINYLGER